MNRQTIAQTVWLRVGSRRCYFNVEVDVQDLVDQLGGRAARSKRKVSKIGHGAVLVRYVGEEKST